MPNVNVLAGKYRPLGYQQITDVSSAVGLTVPDGARLAIIQPQTVSIRWRDDGTNPTTTVGMVLAAGADFAYSGNLDAIKLIETAATSIVNVSYFA